MECEVSLLRLQRHFCKKLARKLETSCPGGLQVSFDISGIHPNFRKKVEKYVQFGKEDKEQIMCNLFYIFYLYS